MKTTIYSLLLFGILVLTACHKDGFSSYEGATFDYPSSYVLNLTSNFYKITSYDEVDTLLAHNTMTNKEIFGSGPDLYQVLKAYDLNTYDIYLTSMTFDSSGDSPGGIEKYKVQKSDKLKTIQFKMKFGYTISGGSGAGIGHGILIFKVPKTYTDYKIEGIIKFHVTGGIMNGAKDYKRNYSTQ